MDKIGIKILDNLSYEEFESFQYFLDYDFEYSDMIEYIEKEKVIELDIEEDEDRDEDIEALKILLNEFNSREIKYEIYSYSNEWRSKTLSEIC
jgi:hypothetical protein